MAFTTLALLGLAAAGGAFGAKALSPGPNAQAQGDASSRGPGGTAVTPATPPTPPDAGAAASAAAVAGNTAAAQTKRRAAGGTDLVKLPASNPMQSGIQPQVQANRTLLGS